MWCTRPWLVEGLDGGRHLPLGEVFDDGAELRILLPHDRAEPGGRDARVLELLIGNPGVDRFVLPDVARPAAPGRWR